MCQILLLVLFWLSFFGIMIAHHRNLHQYYNFHSLVDNVLCYSYHYTMLCLDPRLHHYLGIRSFCHSYVCIIAVVDDDE